jgi:hypothetical protein
MEWLQKDSFVFKIWFLLLALLYYCAIFIANLNVYNFVQKLFGSLLFSIIKIWSDCKVNLTLYSGQI